MTTFTELVGRTIQAIGIDEPKENVVFACADGSRWRMYHEQECCENVYLAETIGDVSDLLGTPIVVAEERVAKQPDSNSYESSTWTFYELRTIKGSVTLRWVGESNGYYSESVDFGPLETGAGLPGDRS